MTQYMPTKYFLNDNKTVYIRWFLTYIFEQDKYDDVIVGVKSTALKFGESTPYWLTGFSAAMITGLTVAGTCAHQSWPFYAAVGATATHLLYQVTVYDISFIA